MSLGIIVLKYIFIQIFYLNRYFSDKGTCQSTKLRLIYFFGYLADFFHAHTLNVKHSLYSHGILSGSASSRLMAAIDRFPGLVKSHERLILYGQIFSK